MVFSIDLRGHVFGQLTAVEPTDRRCFSSVIWHCTCTCGGTKDVPASRLRAGVATSCGCRKYQGLDLRNQVFSRLTAVESVGRATGGVLWRCTCICGQEKTTTATLLRSGLVRSCGCLRTERALDLRGQTFGRLTAQEPTGERYHRHIVWRCRCDCGASHDVPSLSLTNRSTRSCGGPACVLPRGRPKPELRGQVFGRLAVVESVTAGRWRCTCTCGGEKIVRTGNLKSGATRSCGCLAQARTDDRTHWLGQIAAAEDFLRDLPEGHMIERFCFEQVRDEARAWLAEYSAS